SRLGSRGRRARRGAVTPNTRTRYSLRPEGHQIEWDRTASLPEVAAPVQQADLLFEFGNGPVDDGIRHDLADRQWTDRCRWHAHLVEPPDELLGGRRVDDPPQADPAVRGRTHRAVLTGGVDGCGGAPVGFEMFGGPSCELELGMPGAVAACDAVAVLGQDLAVRIDEHRPERLVAGRDRLLREFDAPPQMLQIRV